MGRTSDNKWNLVLGEDSYSGANAQSPNTARKVTSWIPTDDGQLHRELIEPAYLPTTLSGPACGLYQFTQNNGIGGINRFFFAAARTDFTVGTQTCNFYQQVAGAWTIVSAVGTLADVPACVQQENNFFVSDGVSNFLFDGTDWVLVGCKIPLNQPSANVNNGVNTVFFEEASGVFVDAYLFPHNESYAGQCDLMFPTLISSALGHATGNSIMFNPPALTGTPDPNVQPIQWATINTSGVITGYTTPFAGATQGYCMVVLARLVIPAPGNYTISINHDDGMFFGFGPGLNKSGVPVFVGGPSSLVPSLMAVQGYPAMGGTNRNPSSSGSSGSRPGDSHDVFVVNFPTADTYGLEIDYTNWEDNQELNFAINGVTPLPTTGSNPGVINATIGKYYWFTNADETPGRVTESSSSPIGLVTGPLIGATVDVYQQPGLFSSSNSSPIISVSTSTDTPGPDAPQIDPTMAGDVIYINGVLQGTIASAGDLTFSISIQATGGDWMQSGGTNGASLGPGNIVTWDTNGATVPASAALVLSFLDSGASVIGSPSSLTGSTEQFFTAPAGTVRFVIGFQAGTTDTGLVTIDYSIDVAGITLTGNAATTIVNGRAVICDPKDTNWHVYASESDGSKVGQFLASVPVTQDLATNPFVDNSPFLDDPTNTYLPIFRPVRNDEPPPSKLLEVHKTRQWRRRESQPNFFNFTANEEVTSGNNGDPAQCVPGADINTVSDMVNEVSFPDQSAQIRGLKSHADALYMFSEKQCYPLYGQSVDDFAISQVVAFSCGLAGRFAAETTPHGLPFISYDRKAFLFPMQSTIWSLTPQVNATSALKEIGKPLRNVLKTADPSRLDEIVTCFYFYSIRDWWVVSWPNTAGSYTCYVYDFNIGSWFQLQRGFASIAAFEVSTGEIVLVGGGADGNTYVIDDQTGTFNTVGGLLPASTFRSALIDFGDPGQAHVFRCLELEFSSEAMQKDITLTYWLDPNDVDNPGAGRVLNLRPVLGANRYRAFPQGNGVCQKMLLQIFARSSVNAGVIRGVKLIADTVTGLQNETTPNKSPAFTLVPTSTSVTVHRSGTVPDVVTVVPVFSFADPVIFATYGLPSGVTAAYSPDPAISGAYASTLTFTATSGATLGTFSINVVGTSANGTLQAVTTISLTVAS